MRYYFDINDGGRLRIDTDGHELPDIAAARSAAITELGHIFRDELPDGDRVMLAITVRDEAGIPVLMASATMLLEDFQRR